MKKPDNKTVKEFLIENVSRDLKFEEAIVEKVVNWCYKDASDAAKTEKEMEISGLGKFMISQNKLKKRIESIEKMIQYIGDKDPMKTQYLQETLKDLNQKKK